MNSQHHNPPPTDFNWDLLERDLFYGIDDKYLLANNADTTYTTQLLAPLVVANPRTVPNQIQSSLETYSSSTKRSLSPSTDDKEDLTLTPKSENSNSSGEDHVEENSKRRKMTKDEKMEKRKQQTRAASKTYRQRKKALETDLLERVEKLENEKRALLERLQVSEEVISKLNKENLQIRHAQVNEAAVLKTKTRGYIQLLEKQLLEGAPDQVLYQTIQQVKTIYGDFTTLSQNHLQQMVSPVLLNKMLQLNFFDNTRCCVESNWRAHGIAKVIEEVKKEFPELTPEQLEDLQDLEDEHYQICTEIRSERAGLVGAFKDLLDEKAEKSLDRVVKLATSLELFRQNYIDEGEQWNYSLKEITDILTPKQAAKFMLSTYLIPAGVRQLSIITQYMEPEWRIVGDLI